MDRCTKKVAHSQLIDITETRKLVKKSLNATENPPICFRNGTYCVIKIRKPIIKNDGSYGLLNINSIETIETGSLTLESNKRTTTLESKESIENRIQKAELAGLLIDDYTTNLDIPTK